jgi:uncharacterized protein (TIGR02646 family)
MSAQVRSHVPSVVRSSVPIKSDHQDYREDLRLDFWYSCAYCNIGEIEATALSFEIDHYEPREHSPELVSDYNNLMWSCRLCNRHKGSQRPSESQRASGIRFYRPDWDDSEEHFEIADVELLRHRSNIGKFSIALLFLNRQQLRDLRRTRERIYNSTRSILKGIQSLRGLRIDLFPKDIRLRVLELKKTLEVDVQKAVDDLEDVLQQFNRARSIDPDPNAKELRKQRQQYLKELHALFPK